MLTLEEIRELMKDRRPSALIEATGLCHQTIWRINRGESASYETIKKLSDYFEAQASK